MLDTNIASYVMKRSHGSVLSRFSALQSGEACVSVVAHAELRFGVAVSPAQQRDERALRDFLSRVVVLPLTESVSEYYAQVRADLKQKGTPIGHNDLFIAAHALGVGCTLVTNNVREFRRVAGLEIENWAQTEPVN